MTQPSPAPAARTVSLGGGNAVPYPEPTSAAATAVGKANARKTTRPEAALRSQLHRQGLRFRKEQILRCSNGVRVRPDIVFAGARVAVFIDGCFWHCCPTHGNTPTRNQAYWIPKLAANVERDRRADAALTADGWHVERIWEHDAALEAAERVVAIVRSRHRPAAKSPSGNAAAVRSRRRGGPDVRRQDAGTTEEPVPVGTAAARPRPAGC